MSEIEFIKVDKWIDDNDFKIAARLFQAREEAGVNREQLSVITGISLNDITNYERGIEPVPASVLFFIAQSLKVDFNFFMNSEDDADIPDSGFARARKSVESGMLN